MDFPSTFKVHMVGKNIPKLLQTKQKTGPEAL